MKISKLLIPVVLTTSIPPISVLVGCSNNKIDHTYDKITSEIKQDAISEFIELSKIYRETYFTRGICNWLKQRIQEICPEATILEDDYNASLEDSTVDPDKSSGNLIIDIPASPGMENNKKICFQAHMDMVCVADSPEALEQMKQNGVSVEINSTDNTMTSAGKHTSLGADDGIGVAIMLALLKNKNIAHGPIKYIITADEENGGGAK
ncbi:MAG: hypothetical protein MJ201_01115 [Mycoplasmoidaceae bacterium]|nr:hypothetical protein [Mycoplasmoidaceae bacterium]